MAAVRTMEVSQQPGTARRVRRAASSNADLPTALQDVETGAQHQMGSDIPSSQTPIRSRRATSEASNSHKSAVSGDATLTSSVVRAGLKRKRQPPADIPVRVCAICHTHTRDREEGILICINCSKAGHPTCFQLIKIIDNIRPYLQKWQCVDCKSCQECNINDEHVMLCDSCDRGAPPLDCNKLAEADWMFQLGIHNASTHLLMRLRMAPGIVHCALLSPTRKSKGRM
ncbi:hypothetical protein BKA62DRAFT_299799 [Auriculariales sp. MPI-PUGE-AT-0066]|nr:hypothetical protein BKA62DRAFT_299799 [Auriculariales sp. MPI-PUGE-AT-0066]